MFIDHVPIPLLKLIWPIEDPIPKPRTKPLRVICLGLGRTGTESLKAALHELGHYEIYHGFRITEADGVRDCPQWFRLAYAKRHKHDQSLMTAAEFDKVIGDCEAVTDAPTAGFGPELLRAYPDAKVILNRRRDINAWNASTQKTMATMYADWPSWFRQWANAELFWLNRHFTWATRAIYDFDINNKAIEVYYRHYAELEAELRAQNRPWLDWYVEDGYEPICEFLHLPVPEKPFPNGNAPSAFAETRRKNHAVRIAAADRRLFLLGTTLVAGAVAVSFQILKRRA